MGLRARTAPFLVLVRVLSLVVYCDASTYSIDWSLVSTSTSPAASSKDAASQTCTCDVTDNKCDINCCCDTDCSAKDKVTLFSCCCEYVCDNEGSDYTEPYSRIELPSQPLALIVFRCCCAYGFEWNPGLDSASYARDPQCSFGWSEEAAVNRLDSICPSSTERTAKNVSESSAWSLSCDNKYRDMSFWTKYVLCVTESNAGDDYSNTDQVLYFDSTPTSTVSSNGLLASAGFGGIAQDVVTHPQHPEYSTTSAYSLGDTIIGAYVTSSTAVESTASTGFMNWFVPSRGMSANCESQRPIQFGVDLDDWCVVEVEALSTSCTAASTALLPSAFTSLDSLSYGSMLHVASSPTTVPGSSTGWIRSYVRAAAGVTEHEQLESAADAGVYDSLIQPKWDSTLTTCMNTMHNLTYHVTYSASSGAITMVNVSVAVGNTTMKTDGDASITQGFSVRWYADGGTPEYARDRSGSPGYIEGLPVLGAASSTSGTKTAYLQSTDGARVLGAGPGGVCSNQTHNPILFNTAMKTECSISFASATELETYCGRSLTSAVGANLPWPLGGPLTWSFVGMLGNAEPRYTGNWTTVVESGTAPTASWLSSVSTCSSIVSGIEIDFVVANTGERVSPQAAIIGAQVSYVSESWAFKNIATVDGAQTFTHSVTVRWHEYDNNIYERMPGFTPTETTMPDDVLHPFYPFN